MAQSKRATPAGPTYRSVKDLQTDVARLSGILSRCVGVLGIPWKHDDPQEPIYLAQIKALDKYLTEKQCSLPLEPSKPKSETIDGVDIPFG